MDTSPQAAPAIDGLVDAWTTAWNAHDMHRAATLVEPDVDFVTVAGRWLRGREEFLSHHRDIHGRHMRTTAWTTLAHAERRLRDDLVVAHVEWVLAGELDPDGAPRPPRAGIFTWVIRRRDGAWRIAVAHNTNLRADTPHRLAARGTS